MSKACTFRRLNRQQAADGEKSGRVATEAEESVDVVPSDRSASGVFFVAAPAL